MFVSPDTIVPDAGDVFAYNRYAYARLNPLKYSDPTGHVWETIWDAANIGIGAASLTHNVRNGNWGDAAWDTGGLVVDVAATAVPFVPGGASTAIKMTRAADKAVDAARFAGRASDALSAGVKITRALPDATKIGSGAISSLDLAKNLGFRQFTKHNYRKGLLQFTDVSKDAAKGLEAHHLLPKEFEKDFVRLGIENIHDPRMLSWVDAGTHRTWSHEYNNAWRTFLRTNPSRDQILQKAADLAKTHGYDINFQLPRLQKALCVL